MVIQRHPEGRNTVLPPYIAYSIVLALVLAHCDESFLLQYWQSPQAIWKLATTLSPFLTFFTAEPTSSTIPYQTNDH